MKVIPILKLDTNNKSKSNKDKKEANKAFREMLASLKK